MNKKIVLFCTIFSSLIFGMENVQQTQQLNLCYEIGGSGLNGSGLICPLFPITFKETEKKGNLSIAILSDPTNTPRHFRIQLPKKSYTDLGLSQKHSHVSTILNREQTVSAFEDLLLNKNYYLKTPVMDYIIMTIHSSDGEEYELLLEKAELPALIKERCNIKSLSKAEIRNFFILVPLCCASYLLYHLT